MQTALILSLSATHGLGGVMMIESVAVLAERPSWESPTLPTHPR